MKRCIPLFILALTLFLSAPLATASGSKTRNRQIDSLIAQYVQPGTPGCAVAVVQNGKLLYQKTCGLMNLEYDLPITRDTRFNIGSASKQFTAAAILLLTQEGKLSLDDDIHTWLPEWPEYGHKITIDHLLHHTSGIIDYDWLQALAGWNESTPSRQVTLDLIARVDSLNFPPGTAYYYSNSGYLLLGMIVERVTGRSLAEFVGERIFKPLQMTHSVICDDAGLIIPQRADSYIKGEDGTFRGLRAYNAVIAGDSNVYTTIEDLLKWDANFYTERVGGSGFARRMTTRGTLARGDSINYAMGLQTEPYRGIRTVYHGGLTHGYKSHYLQCPDQHFSVICLANALNIDSRAICRGIVDLFLAAQLTPAATPPAAPKKEEGPAAIILDPRLYQEYIGKYGLGGNVIITVSSRGGRLYGQVAGQQEFELFPESESLFFIKATPAKGGFQRDSTGTVTTLAWQQGGRTTKMARLAEPAPPEEKLAGLTGTFYSPVLQTTYAILLKEGSLWLKMPEMPEMLHIPVPAPLNHLHQWKFAAPFATLEFEVDDKGSAKGFLYSNPSGRVQLQFSRQE
jgi:CubicO group peptidase (beta-lactamase class C family)